MWRAWGITNESELMALAIGAVVMAVLMLHAGIFHYHKAAPKMEWFQDIESMLNHHIAGLVNYLRVQKLQLGSGIYMQMPMTLMFMQAMLKKLHERYFQLILDILQ